VGSLTWLTYALWDAFFKMTSLLECFDSFNVHANYFLDWALQLMYVHDQLMIIISSSSMVAKLGMGAGPSKLW
jgi:hypothetical protein